jgi:hypothetical protein
MNASFVCIARHIFSMPLASVNNSGALCLSGLQSNPISNKPPASCRTPSSSTLTFSWPMFLAFVIVARWVQPFGFMASMAFGLVFAYLTIYRSVVVWVKGTVIGESRLQLNLLVSL